MIPEPMRERTRNILMATARPRKRELTVARVFPEPSRSGMDALTLSTVKLLGIPSPLRVSA